MRAPFLMAAVAVLVSTSALAAPHAVAGGVYFARLESAGKSAVRKLVRLGR